MSLEQNSAGTGRYARIPAAICRSGLSRSTLYEFAAAHPGLFKKAGAATIVDLVRLDEILAALPDAAIKAPAA
jgi:hypothetical protein